MPKRPASECSPSSADSYHIPKRSKQQSTIVVSDQNMPTIQSKATEKKLKLSDKTLQRLFLSCRQDLQNVRKEEEKLDAACQAVFHKIMAINLELGKLEKDALQLCRKRDNVSERREELEKG
ncbi:hypothetical protein BJ508DRAFT_25992 [Ascobolus immersus RN42]|uniref:Uncharacterized protein n=1 Tax=Ascobolus immersus RN42 TaxID=1160509 RepID=A0A3N4ISX3_ASCIM|nr:hypothetical protein BJ508DRAFT_25992 [Ascobolus immersus RN42]